MNAFLILLVSEFLLHSNLHVWIQLLVACGSFDPSLVRIKVLSNGQLLEDHLLCSHTDSISRSCTSSQSLIYFDQVGEVWLAGWKGGGRK